MPNKKAGNAPAFFLFRESAATLLGLARRAMIVAMRMITAAFPATLAATVFVVMPLAVVPQLA